MNFDSEYFSYLARCGILWSGARGARRRRRVEQKLDAEHMEIAGWDASSRPTSFA